MEAWETQMICAWQPTCRRRRRWAVACSGGPDSQALMHLLARHAAALGIHHIEAVGVDHGLRSAACGELALAAAQAAALGLTFSRLRVRVGGQGNLLAAARQARRAALADFAAARGLQAVALGHHADDQLETVLHHLSRGCGLRGASGMAARAGVWVRPLLPVGRAELQAYLRRHGLAWAVDPSNADPRRLRAQLRAEVLPPLRSVLPEAATQVGLFAQRARADDTTLWRLARRRLRRASAASPWGQPELAALPMPAVRGLPRSIFVRLMSLWLVDGPLPATTAPAETPEAREVEPVGARPRRSLDAAFLAALWRARRAQTARLWRPPWQVVVEHGWMFRLPTERLAACGRDEAAEQLQPLRVPGETAMGSGRGSIAASWHDGDTGRPAYVHVAPRAQVVAFDADQLPGPPCLRVWRPGDRLQPWGLAGKGSCTVGDLFTNLKVPRPLRPGWPVVVAGSTLLWVPGICRSAAAPVTPSSRRILRLEFAGPHFGADVNMLRSSPPGR